MKIIVEADQNQLIELKEIEGVNWVSVENDSDFNQNRDALAYFNFVNKDFNKYFQLPVVLVNQLAEVNDLGKNVSILNAWPGFLSRDLWEISGNRNEMTNKLISGLGKKAVWIKGEFVSTRVISMIINEAYFAFEENVSSKDEINTAMKLGTGYPYGPFEWAEKIGKRKIYNFLNHLSKSDKRYIPSTTLKNEANS